jgi:plasmid stabilization system protein ParE
VKAYVFHPEAEDEYIEATEYYKSVSPELADRFSSEVERLIEDIRQQPDLYRIYDNPARRHFSDVFPYAVIYLDRPDHVLILAVMHMKLRPRYWRERLF